MWKQAVSAMYKYYNYDTAVMVVFNSKFAVIPQQIVHPGSVQ